jgi:hypothetical protein
MDRLVYSFWTCPALGENPRWRENNQLLKNVNHKNKEVDNARHLQTILDNISEPVITTDADFKIQTWNKAAAKVYALDIQDIDTVWNGLKNNDRIILHTSVDAYSKEFVQSEFLDKEIKFDMMLDDGPHTLESMKSFITLYSPLLADNGILIIEDIQDPKWINELYKVVPDDLKQFVSAYDLRKNKNRYDDIVLTIRNKK